jgi:hypothetical protein
MGYLAAMAPQCALSGLSIVSTETWWTQNLRREA